MRLGPVFLLICWSSSASAQTPPPRSPFTGQPVAPPAAAAAKVTREAPRSSGPEARTGFQMHIVPFLAFSFPFGDATDAPGDSLGARYSWQWVPLEVGLGAKVLEPLYFGGYLNFAVGSEGSDLHTERRCEAGNDVSDDVSCSAVSVHLGVELRYTFTPAESASGWVGYGAGWTTASQSISDAGHYEETSTVQGVDWARLSGSVDFRVSRGFGLGPFAAVSIGRYVQRRTEIRSVETFSGGIDERAFHAWLSLGLRMVIFP